MIFVTTGTERHPFDRLVAAVDRLAADGAFGGRAVLIQAGASTIVPQACASVKILSYGEMVEKVRAAQLVIAHGGAGSFMVCRQQRTPLIMVPRLRRLGENVDDHQVLFCRRLAALGLCEMVEDVTLLGGSVARALAAPQVTADPGRVTRLAAGLHALAAEWTLESASRGGR
jgi:UDP-N-acetylglucosamine transferase subunit ALG13